MNRGQGRGLYHEKIYRRNFFENGKDEKLYTNENI